MMIKRLTTLFLTKVYLITAFGFALNLHYCGSVLAAVTVNSPAKSCKPVAVMKMKCCKEKQVDVKIRDAHQAESPSLMTKLFGFELSKIPFGDFILSAQQALLDKLSKPAPPPPPPPSGKTAQYIKNCSLRI
ncbi:hypothetical protein [Mucilaginibacter sp. UR6-11]|uniref:HYC_CC_PP family protein n=1 Tax=Mucilaginibacter sp. UR6-11 TaxID=1435644 RepID=UPI001E599381|nr:hypothetical protein [Mucilaginibacter sp. UR6-11]MCC8424522.1 hypothetical protein [Mucilaginibacter sp. UR6-11]